MELFLFIFITLLIKLSFISLDKADKKGKQGENRVIRILNKLPTSEYKVINNLLMQTDQISTQIDHIIISIYGIFVLETKHYTGWIHGNEKQYYWYQTIYKHKRQFINPIKQNMGHIYSLKKILKKIPYINYLPIVIFVGNNIVLKNITSKNPVIYEYQLLDQIYKHKQLNLDTNMVDKIYNFLTKINCSHNQKKVQEHRRRIKDKYN